MFCLKNYVEQNSGGRIKVEIYDSGVLGGSSEGLSQCMQNVVQACVTGDGELSTLYPKLQVLCVPYLFDDRTQFYDMLDSEFMASLFNDMRNRAGNSASGFFGQRRVPEHFQQCASYPDGR